MTLEEAYKWFSNELKDGKCSDGCVQCNANEIARHAIGKTISKKPKKEPYISLHPHFHIGYTNHCPTCGVVIKKHKVSYIYPSPINFFCFACGQALDWGKDNE